MIQYDKKFIKVLSENKEDIEKASQEMDISFLTSKILFNRGLKNKDEIIKFLNPKYNDFYDPFLLNDMKKATERILSAIEKDESIWIFGDYDVDGVTSTSLLVNFFSSVGIDVRYYIPNRHTEGYGLNKSAIEYIKEQKGDLIITVDCGITSIEEANFADSIGIDMIITDHHTPSENLPEAIAVINPNRRDSNYPFKKLAGVGVAFKLVQAISMEFRIEVDISLLPIVAIGTVADIVDLMDENRLIVKKGLELIKESSNIGIQSLIEVTGLRDKDITSGHIGFIIGPRINAAGRMDSANIGVELFTTNDPDLALDIAKRLDEENKKRQLVERDILEQAEKIIVDNNMENDNVIVLSSKGWHAGVIGIVSSRITEKYHRPSVLISIDDEGIGKASARSIEPLNIYNALKQCDDLFLGFGGHSQAAGLSIQSENINTFRNNINEIVGNMLDDEDFVKEITVDAIIEAEDISINTVKELETLAPFGMGNSSPVFLFEDAIARDIRAVGKDKTHLKLSLLYKDIDIDSIGFNFGYLISDIENTDILNIIGTLDINEYMNKKKVQIMIRDIIFKSKNIEQIKKTYFKKMHLNISKGLEKYPSGIISKNDIDKFNYLYKKIIKSEKLKVYVNDIEHLNFIMTKIDKSGRDIFKKIDLVINPTDNDIIYDEKPAILYDLPIDKSIYDKIKDIHPDIEILCSIKDLEKNKSKIKKWTPNIEELRFIYKTFISKDEIFKFQIYKYIASLSKYNLSKIKIELALIIFNQTGLLQYKKIDSENYYIKLNKTNNKIDINSSTLLKNLNEYVL
ncbi:single-stranded-DNA-specific exonuclease RecJ [Senegalia massiliensis]|uniref:single-stranded-DNA-specific exonuclease RecJ n=1 Tax=Senegalia massiliensis TaxID=1720316 RepID=UPI0010323EA3|nr:single-stranded-DNA-specific exonuclease RecJ [Senegalia massiliensis]